MEEGEEVALNGNSPKERLITTLQYRINEARNNHKKVTTIFVSTLSECMIMLKDKPVKAVENVLFDDGNTKFICGSACGCCGKQISEPSSYCWNCGKKIDWGDDDGNHSPRESD